jgi:predicted RNA methylase
MKLGKSTQSLYNKLRLHGLVANISNFIETREREFRHARDMAVEKALAVAADSKQGVFTTKAGIFRGLRWPRMVYIGSVFAPKVLGTYELEIQEVFAELARAEQTTTFIDIGAAEGYYAVGAALLNPNLRVIAFERQLKAHQHIRDLATENAVHGRIELRGEFDLSELDEEALGERPLVLMDVEGAEAQLIDERFVNRFGNASLIVEVHDFAIPGVATVVESMLSRTHRVSSVRFSRAARRSLRAGMGLSQFEWRVATDEKRPTGNHWLIANPRDILQ